MADSPASASAALPGESPAQTKARLRRERLAAKSGASRLQQIQGLQGGPPKDLSEFVKDVPGSYSLFSFLLHAAELPKTSTLCDMLCTFPVAQFRTDG